MKIGRIHAATRLTPRLARVLEFLRLRGKVGATTVEIIRACNVCAVNTIAAELKALGYTLDCEPAGVGEDGSRPYRYRVIEAQPGQAPLRGVA